MIYGLRKKFILISTISVVIVFFVIFAILYSINKVQLNGTMDTLTDAIASNNGVFPEFDGINQPVPAIEYPGKKIITEETRFSTRFFTVWLGDDNCIVKANMDSVFSISEAQTQKYVEEALEKNCEKGWLSDYRFRVFESEGSKAVVFVNGEMNRMMANRFLFSAFFILTGSGIAVLILIIIISKRVVYPAAESYEKQKQFITDANHELKTPLTLILSDLDIVESEIGKNEWLDDMRCEGQRMRMLINHLVILSRMDEDQSGLTVVPFDLSSALSDTVSEFRGAAASRQISLKADIEDAIKYKGDEALLRRLLAILLDNAVKYCDSGGEIQVIVRQKRHPVIVVENTCRDVDSLKLEKLFDRFYRADKARTFDGSFGIGLSIARAIARNHHGDIRAYKKERLIGFKAELK